MAGFTLDKQTIDGLADLIGGPQTAEVDALMKALKSGSSEPDLSQLGKISPMIENHLSMKSATTELG